VSFLHHPVRRQAEQCEQLALVPGDGERDVEPGLAVAIPFELRGAFLELRDVERGGPARSPSAQTPTTSAVNVAATISWARGIDPSQYRVSASGTPSSPIPSAIRQ